MARNGLQTVSSAGPIAKLNRVRAALEKAKSLDEVVDIVDQSKAIATYAKAIGLSHENVNAAVEVKLRAERKAGELLAGMVKQGGDRKSKLHDETLKLPDLGITKIQSHRWQKLSKMPEDAFTSFVAETNEGGNELTTASVLRRWSADSKPSNGPDLSQGDSLPAALERLHRAIAKIHESWPEGQLSSLAIKLRDYADEIESHGGLAL